MDITAQMDNLVGWSPNGDPIVSGSSSVSSVEIMDSQTFIIGGIERSTFVDVTKGVPVLKDIPVLGYFFGKSSKEEIKSQVLIFLTPHIVGTKINMEELTKERLKKVREVKEK